MVTRAEQMFHNCRATIPSSPLLIRVDPRKIGGRDSPAGFKNKKKSHCEKDLIYCSQPSGQQNVTHYNEFSRLMCDKPRSSDVFNLPFGEIVCFGSLTGLVSGVSPRRPTVTLKNRGGGVCFFNVGIF